MKIYTGNVKLKKEFKKAEHGDPDAMIRAAFTIFWRNPEAHLKRKDVRRGLRYYKCAAEAGDRSAMMDLGALYMNGAGVKEDPDLAMEWYERGFDSDDGRACFCMGAALFYCFPQDHDKRERARQILRRGAELGDPGCMYEIAEMKLFGSGIEKDERGAYELLEKAMITMDKEIFSGRLARVSWRLGECHLYGIGTERDCQRAFEYLEEADIYFWIREKHHLFDEKLLHKRAEEEMYLSAGIYDGRHFDSSRMQTVEEILSEA